MILDKPPTKRGSLANVGLPKDVVIDKRLTAGIRVTVKLDPEQQEGSQELLGQVAPSAPRTKLGLYWGYTVRLADSLSSVFTQSPFKGGYDHTIGTSERG